MSKEKTGSEKWNAIAVDLFCGIGGMTHGFVKEGFTVSAGIDIDESCKYAFEKNNGSKFICEPIEKFNGKKLSELYPEDCVKILIGCAPCQPFSKYTNRYAKTVSYDGKWGLLSKFAELIDEVLPDIVSMENVPELIKHKKYSVFDDFLNTLVKNEYEIDSRLVFCPDYGIPQKRKRLVLLASRLGSIKLIEPTHDPDEYMTVSDAISHLDNLEAGETHPEDPLHRAAGLSDLNLRRINSTPEGGGWKDWDKSLVSKCHRKRKGKTYVSVYGRMSWNEPSPTITTQCYGFGNGRFGHPEQSRAISLREATLLQTFPEDYEFFKSDSEYFISRVGKHIGNAVPVDLGRVIAKSIKRHLEVKHD